MPVATIPANGCTTCDSWPRSTGVPRVTRGHARCYRLSHVGPLGYYPTRRRARVRPLATVAPVLLRGYHLRGVVAVQNCTTKDMILERDTVCQANVGRLSVTRLRTDNAKEFICKDFKSWLKEKGIQQEPSSPYAPESNRKAERLNWTLMDMARTLMVGISHLKGHEQLWAGAIHTAKFPL